MGLWTYTETAQYTPHLSLAKCKQLFLLCGHCRFYIHPTPRSPLLAFLGTPHHLGSFLLLCLFCYFRLPDKCFLLKVHQQPSTLQSPSSSKLPLFLNFHPSIQSAHLTSNLRQPDLKCHLRPHVSRAELSSSSLKTSLTSPHFSSSINDT